MGADVLGPCMPVGPRAVHAAGLAMNSADGAAASRELPPPDASAGLSTACALPMWTFPLKAPVSTSYFPTNSSAPLAFVNPCSPLPGLDSQPLLPAGPTLGCGRSSPCSTVCLSAYPPVHFSLQTWELVPDAHPFSAPPWAVRPNRFCQVGSWVRLPWAWGQAEIDEEFPSPAHCKAMFSWCLMETCTE